ncbi:MAG: class I SAM-dependent methyltransferase [Deltaproteobacteria bacterium]|nr:class I SAM-dependent methyltransferase [Deltaproteobacteria bacterium]
MFDDALDGYLNQLIPEREGVLAEMEAVAKENNFPIIGPHVGRLLAILARATGAKRIFEMGSGYGYSAAWFAQGLAPGGRIVCTDGSPRNRDKAMDYLERLGAAERVDFRVGNAIDLLRKERKRYDIIYNDIDKEQYPEAADVAATRLRPGIVHYG